MSSTPPVGYGYYQATFKVAGAARAQSFGFGFQNVAAYGSAGAALLGVQTILKPVGRFMNPSYYTNTGTLVEEYCLLHTGLGLLSAVSTVTAVGTSTFNAVPPNVSGIVHKSTAYAGRAYRGRIALPSCYLDEADVDVAGNIGGSLTAINTALGLSRTGLSTAGIPMVLIHGMNKAGLTPPPDVVVGFQLGGMVGTEARRLKR